uniref:ATP synthase complex subunit 8 n=1 Tax=Ornebius bimaculatus TaxID=2153490 RepID=A0A385I1Z4_9ORTH|nr:ATP synthase F0 subunit 8 [Ornebius bimaculatus]AXY63927.1 ATP synthase F0 subunit 8 [Ornebius bimaculatus]
MPQMAPLWWTILYLYFLMSLIIISTFTFFIYNKYPHKTFYSKKNKFSTNWMW